MKFKFAVRSVILIILINTIVSENIMFSNTSKISTSRCPQKLETGTVYDPVGKSADRQKIASVSSKLIAEYIKSDRNWQKTCSGQHEPDNIIVKKVLEDFDIKFQSKLSWSGDILFGSLLAVFSFLSFLGNSCAVVIFLFQHRRLNSAEVFFINLAILDILLSISSYPMSIAAALRHRWDFGQTGCTVYGFVCYFLGVASICSITSIALIRYFKTCDPVRGCQITCQMAYKIMALGYLIALVWAVMPLAGFGSYEVEPYGLSCTLKWMASNMTGRFYIILVTIFLVFVPLFIITFCYIQILRVVKRSKRKMEIDCVTMRSTRRSDVRLTWISILITTGFVVAWSPYTVVCLYSSFWNELLLPLWATSLPSLLAKSSIILNPLIYIFFTERYRNDFAKQVKGWCSRSIMPKRKQLCK